MAEKVLSNGRSTAVQSALKQATGVLFPFCKPGNLQVPLATEEWTTQICLLFSLKNKQRLFERF